MALCQDVRRQVLAMVRERDVPNLILVGPPGVGKTTLVKCLARELYGDSVQKMFLEINAADNRGLRVGKAIADFESTRPPSIRDLPGFKLVFFDEANSATDGAKGAIGALVSNANSNMRAALACNDKRSIPASIQDWCHVLCIRKLGVVEVAKRAREVCVEEGVPYDESALAYLADLSRGDMRVTINTLEVVYRRFKKLTVRHISDSHDDTLGPGLVCVTRGELDIGEVVRAILGLIDDGYSGVDVMLCARKAVIDSNDVETKDKVVRIEAINHYLYNAYRGAESKPQAISCVGRMRGLP